jgi:hypothetical protein
MAIASILLGVGSLLMMFGGIFLVWMPGVGSMFAFGGPILALVGIVLGGLAMSRAKQEGNPSGAALAGVILNVVGFLFGLIVAMTCGLCNAACTSAMINAHPSDGGVGWQGSFQLGPDGGGMMLGPVDAGTGAAIPEAPQSMPGAPPPAFPPPPVAPGPSGGSGTTGLAPPPPGETSGAQP